MAPLTRIVLTIFAISLLAGPLFAQSMSRANGSASGRIVSGISINKIHDLRFGHIITGPTAGTVLLNPATAVRTATGGVLLGNYDGTRVAEFAVLGEPGYTFALTFPASILVTRNGNGNGSMSVTNFAASIGQTGILNTNGSAQFTVGARLNVGANQRVGIYQGSFSVTAAYN